ncbi:MAG: hypothetical protein RLY21_1783 [Planctomycetota bacterium]
MFGRTRRAVHATLAATALPEELKAFIGSLVARTRLRRAEQLDIAAELASHFSEGLAAGKSAEALMASYGDARQSARDLRAGAIAKRGSFDRAAGMFVKWGSIGVAAVLAVYLGSATVLYLREPVISFDARAAVNARLPEAGPEGRALDIYIAALADESGRYRQEWSVKRIGAIEEALLRVDEDPAAEATARAELAEMRGTIELLRAVRTRPVFGLGIKANGLTDDAAVRFFGLESFTGLDESYADGPLASSLLSVALPQLSVLRPSAKLLCYDARIAAKDGRVDDFLASIEAASMVGRHVGEFPFLISELVEIGIQRIVLDEVRRAVGQTPAEFSDAHLARLEEIVRAQQSGLAVGIEGERLMVRDLIQRCFSDDGHGDGVLLPRAWGHVLVGMSPRPPFSQRPPTVAAFEFLSGPLAATAFPSRREVTDQIDAQYDAAIAVANASTRDEFDARMGAYRERADDLLADPSNLLEVLIPALDKALENGWKLREAVHETADVIARERAKRADSAR